MLGPSPPEAPADFRRSQELRDAHGRVITDLRLSVTDRCNFRCTYCLEPGTKFLPRQELLHRDEYLRLVQAAVGVGIRTLRLTGGEPTLYPELDELIKDLGQLELDDMAMTTNGWSVTRDRSRRWLDAGLRRLTFSLDTLQEDRMQTITRSRTTVREVLDSIMTARDSGFPRPKVNMVVMTDVNHDEVADFAALARTHDLDVRFIEFMPLDSGRNWEAENVFTMKQVQQTIEQRWPLKRSSGDAPHSTSTNWLFADDAPGKVGFISPVSSPFCGACNRLRVTAEGKIRPCLFSHAEWDVRPLLRRGLDESALQEFLIDAAWNKPRGHDIGNAEFQPPERTMSAIGG